ncbi:MAG: hypothetical protein AAB371_02190 [Patescibacteria group bacterium]
MKYAIPPYDGLGYFLVYSYHLFFKKILWRVVSAVSVLTLIFIFNKLFKSSLFYSEEFYLLTYLGFLIEFPLGLFLLPIGLLILMFAHLLQPKKALSTKYSFKHYWSYAAILIIIINITLTYAGIIYKIQP